MERPGLGEKTKRVPTPVHTASSSSRAPELPLRPCPSPCCAIRQDMETRADNRHPREKGLLTVFKIESMEVQALDQVPQGLRFKGCHPRVAHLPRRKETRGEGDWGSFSQCP